jgi:hypothetical protein
MSNLKEIEFLLENCECIKINAQYVYRIQKGEVIKHHYGSGAESWEKDYTDYMVFQLLNSKQAFKYATDIDNKKSAWQRLNACDVTRIFLNYEDGTEEEIVMPWPEYSNYYNFHQFIKENNDYIFIIFNKNKIKRLQYIKAIIKEYYYNLKRKSFRVYYNIKRLIQHEVS